MLVSSLVRWPEPVNRCWKTRPSRWNESLEADYHLHLGQNLESMGCPLQALLVRG